MSGKEMSGKIMENLRNRSDLELDAIWNRVHSAKRDNSPLYLTLRNSELCTAPLPSEHFFGREEELYDLKELLLRGGKYLVCGLGGIGKTELLRQLIRWCEREGAAPDSQEHLNTLLGKDYTSREYIVQQNLNNTLAIVKGQWKYIEPSDAPAIEYWTKMELGNDRHPQLYDLSADPSEKNNVAKQHPEVVRELSELLESVKTR